MNRQSINLQVVGLILLPVDKLGGATVDCEGLGNSNFGVGDKLFFEFGNSTHALAHWQFFLVIDFLVQIKISPKNS